MAKSLSVAEYLSKAIELSGKTQREIAEEIGFTNANVLSMMKKGITKVPVDRVGALADAMGVDKSRFFKLVLNEYQPGTLQMIEELGIEILDDDERVALEAFRKSRL